MFFSDWRLLLRRWYVVAVGLLATLALCFVASRFVPTRYEATSGILLLPPSPTSDGVPDNPFLSLGGLDTVSAVVARAATDRAMQTEVTKAGGTGTYTVEPDIASGGPVLLITVDDVTPGGALTTLRVLATRLPALLKSLQTTSGVRESALIRSRQLIQDNVAQPVRKPLIRALLVALAVGLAGTVLVASLVDGFLTRRARDRDDPEPQPAVGTGPPPRDPAGFEEPWTDDQPAWSADRRGSAYRDRDYDRYRDYGRRRDHDRDPVGRHGTRIDPYSEAAWADRREAEAWAEAGNAWADGVREVTDDPGRYGRPANGRAADDELTTGSSVDRPRADGTPVHDGALNGTPFNDGPVNGTSVTGSPVNGSAVNGTPLNGASGNGSSGNGSSVNGASVNGTSVNGTSGNGAPVSGGPVNGSAVSGTSANGGPVNGTSVNVASGYGPSVDGVAGHGTAADAAGIDEPTRIIPAAKPSPDSGTGLIPASGGAAVNGGAVNSDGVHGIRTSGTANGSTDGTHASGPTHSSANGSGNGYANGTASSASGRAGRGGVRRATDRPAMPWWASPTDPDPTEEIVYERVTDLDPTVEIAYDRLAASLREMQDENRRTEPG
jgi:hypothetical protein